MNNVADLLVLNANRYPEKTVIVHREHRLSYRELNERVNRLAHHLMDMGVEKGDRVGFMFYNSPQFVEIYFAALKIGATAVPINFRLVPREVKWTLDHAKCKVFAYSEDCKEQVNPVKDSLSTVEHLIYSGEDIPADARHFEALASEGQTKEPNRRVALEDRALIIFTGGTTGVSKGVVHTHKSTLAAWTSICLRFRMSVPDEFVLLQIPMFHSGGINMIGISVLSGGGFAIVETFDPLEILRLIDQEQATYLALTPPGAYIRLLDVPEVKDFNTTSVRKLAASHGVLTKSLMLRLFDTFPNARLFFAYGLSEASSLGSTDWITRSMVEKDLDRIHSVGREFPFLEMRLVDDAGREVPVGKMGEAIIRGPMIMQGYFDQPDLTAQTIRNGWIYTGDLLRKDRDGFFYYMDRKKDMIKSGGENVFAPEVEAAIASHPSVEMCTVIGLPDPVLAEAVTAIVKLRSGTTAGEEEIIVHCKKTLASYKKPRRIIFVENFPVSETGKIQKFKLRKQYSER